MRLSSTLTRPLLFECFKGDFSLMERNIVSALRGSGFFRNLVKHKRLLFEITPGVESTISCTFGFEMIALGAGV